MFVALLSVAGCVDVRPAATPAAAYRQPIVPRVPVEKPAEAEIVQASAVQPLPAPREVQPVDPKLGSEPPPAPTLPPAVGGAVASRGGPLDLDEVLDAVTRHYPLLQAIEQERRIAGGRLVTSMGAFDFNLAATVEGAAPATYENYRGNIGIAQALPVGGIGLFAGYRQGYGDFTDYALGAKTADGGEFRAGIAMPLLRDRAIDRPRAAVQQARLDVQLAEPVIERQRLDFHRAAARTYWNWVGAGQRLKISDSLVKLAVERDEQLKERVLAGPTANIERIDNQQNIALRNGVLVQAQRAFQQASIDLSLFLRDESGQPTLAGPERLPNFPEVVPIEAKSFAAALQTALDQRPEPRRLRLQREKALVDLRLANNQAMPSVNAVVAGSQDIGYGRSSLSGPNGLDRSNLNAGLVMALPVQQRDARGRAIAAQAQLAQVDQQLRNAEDVIRAEVQDAFSALDRAHEFYRQSKKRVELARLVARAEREQLRLGRSDVLRVTLREQAAFEAEVFEIGAQQEYFRAWAEYVAALGLAGPVPAK